MSGADCNNGCTACPTCRGEVQPNAPAMHDMNFAMSMEWRAFADPMWGPLRVAQTVRDGMRARGGSADGDAQIRAFLDRHAHPGFPSGNPVGVPFGSINASPEPPVPPVPAPKGAPGSITLPEDTVEDRRKRQEKDLSGDLYKTIEARLIKKKKWRVPGSDSGKPFRPVTNPGGRECCVQDFKYPSEAYAILREGVRGGNQYGLHFEADATYKPNPSPCDCTCCEFVQLVQATVTVAGEEPVTKGVTEDCLWWYASEVEAKPDGTRRFKPGGKIGRPTAFIPIEEKEGETVETTCAGDELDHSLPNPVTSIFLKDACHYWFCDEPSYNIPTNWPYGATTIKWAYIGMIIDTCRPRIMRWAEFVLQIGPIKTSAVVDKHAPVVLGFPGGGGDDAWAAGFKVLDPGAIENDCEKKAREKQGG